VVSWTGFRRHHLYVDLPGRNEARRARMKVSIRRPPKAQAARRVRQVRDLHHSNAPAPRKAAGAPASPPPQPQRQHSGRENGHAPDGLTGRRMAADGRNFARLGLVLQLSRASFMWRCLGAVPDLCASSGIIFSSSTGTAVKSRCGIGLCAGWRKELKSCWSPKSAPPVTIS